MRPETPKTWEPIASAAIADLERIGARVTQCKDKWGELAIYLDPDTPADVRAAAEPVIQAAKAACDAICYDCGAPATGRRRAFAICTKLTLGCPQDGPENEKGPEGP